MAENPNIPNPFCVIENLRQSCFVEKFTGRSPPLFRNNLVM